MSAGVLALVLVQEMGWVLAEMMALQMVLESVTQLETAWGQVWGHLSVQEWE